LHEKRVPAMIVANKIFEIFMIINLFFYIIFL
jgi:hypothetical protein